MVGSRRRQRYHKSARLTDSHIWNTCAGDDTGKRRMSSSPKSGTAPERTPMPVTQDDAATQQSAATRRWGLATWHHRFADRFPDETRYRLPAKW